MPHVIVKLYPGRTDDQKQRLADAIAKNVVEITGCKDLSVSIGIEEVSPQAWGEKVYGPDIRAKWETLVKKPGYEMDE